MGKRLGARDATVLLAFALAGANAAGAVEVVGGEATFQWSAASGPVSGYYVIVSRDAGTAEVEAVSVDTVETLTGSTGETLVVQVAAFGEDGVAGALSPPSSPITFVPDPGEPPPVGDPPPPPPDDPPAPHVARDFDGDGLADLVVHGGDVLALWTLGDAASEIPLPLAPSGAVPVGIADYDGDGDADLLWEHPIQRDLTLWRFEGGIVVETKSLDPGALDAADEWFVAGSGDFDADGRSDLLLASRIVGDLEVWTFDATAAVSGRSRLPGRVGAWSVVAIADLDGDEADEWVWLDELSRSLERDGFDFGAPQALGELAADWRVVGAGDLDGDGRAELVARQPDGGAIQAWRLESSGEFLARDLPNASGLGEFAGIADTDGDGRDDLVWSDGESGIVTLWLGPEGAPQVVDGLLPEGSRVAAAQQSDPGKFRERFCFADLDGNGSTNTNDFTNVFIPCYTGLRGEGCEEVDLDSDGERTEIDVEIFMTRLRGEVCEDF